MTRRDLLAGFGATALAGRFLSGQDDKADFTIRIGPVSVELAPKKIVRTVGYNGTSPGPLLRMAEGKQVSIDVFNDSNMPELVHWHGLHVPAEVDGSMEEGTPMVPPHGHRRYSLTPTPSGTRWYHTHGSAGRNLTRATYTGQFGFLYVEPKSDAARYDQEKFLALREWDPYLSSMEDEGLDVAYKAFSINDRALGYGEPIRVKEGERVMLRILNASATIHRRVAVAGHVFEVTALDGNALADPKKVGVLELGPAERIDAVVEMNNPGVWILGATIDHDRQAGMGIVIEYSGRSGAPVWSPPSEERWSYAVFGSAPQGDPQTQAEAERIVLTFEKKFAGKRWVDKWAINGKSFPKTDPIRVKQNNRYRLVFDNRSDEAHPVHLHRHTFELTNVEGQQTSGVRKDVVVVQPKSRMEVDLVANNPGQTLFHCHQQMHMDYGFMAMMEYV
jgi:FtsP/CotA-like multicopper oxidase with cupredoxin domain